MVKDNPDDGFKTTKAQSQARQGQPKSTILTKLADLEGHQLLKTNSNLSEEQRLAFKIGIKKIRVQLSVISEYANNPASNNLVENLTIFLEGMTVEAPSLAAVTSGMQCFQQQIMLNQANAMLDSLVNVLMMNGFLINIGGFARSWTDSEVVQILCTKILNETVWGRSVLDNEGSWQSVNEAIEDALQPASEGDLLPGEQIATLTIVHEALERLLQQQQELVLDRQSEALGTVNKNDEEECDVGGSEAMDDDDGGSSDMMIG